jgi:hypothetical protein
MFTAAFWKDATIRAIRTAAQVLLVAIGADGTGIAHLDVGGTAAIVGGSILATYLSAIVVPVKLPEDNSGE